MVSTKEMAIAIIMQQLDFLTIEDIVELQSLISHQLVKSVAKLSSKGMTVKLSNRLESLLQNELIR